MSILSLPAELRLRIYDFLLPLSPLAFPRTIYTGLLYSCHHILAELEPEIIKRTVSFFQHVQSRCRVAYGNKDLRYVAPTCIQDLYTFKFTRPIRPGMFLRDDPFMALMYLDFTTLIITCLPPPKWSSDPVYSPNSEMRCYPVYRQNTAALVAWIDKVNLLERQPSAREIVYEWPADPQTRTLEWNAHRITEGQQHWWRERGDQIPDERCYWNLQYRSDETRPGTSPPWISAVKLERWTGKEYN